MESGSAYHTLLVPRILPAFTCLAPACLPLLLWIPQGCPTLCHDTQNTLLRPCLVHYPYRQYLGTDNTNCQCPLTMCLLSTFPCLPRPAAHTTDPTILLPALYLPPLCLQCTYYLAAPARALSHLCLLPQVPPPRLPHLLGLDRMGLPLLLDDCRLPTM